MSINSAMLAGVSGVIANSGALAAISDNISNVNTVGYKRNRNDFTALINQQSRATTYNAGGVSNQTRRLVQQQGLLQQSASPTDLAINGQGMFVVSTVPGQMTASTDVLFTRVGSFATDDDGNLRNQAGFYLQGWPVQPDGSVRATPSDLTGLETVNVGVISGTAEATTSVRFNGNLRASQPVSPHITPPAPPAVAPTPYNAATNNMASGDVRPDAQWPVQVFDSRGGLRTVNVSFLKSDVANEWRVEMHVSPATDVETGSGLVDGQIAVGTLAFTPDGRIDIAATTPALLQPIQFGGYLDPAPGANAVKWATSTGVDAQSVTLDFGTPTSAGGITQFDSPTALVSTASNGAVFGDVAGVEVDREGYVTALFNNGVRRKIYQLPIATFINPDGLRGESGGVFRVTNESGPFNMKQAGVGGSGIVAAGNLENSTVDLATEFTSLITTQRAYSAATRIITTADEMLEEIIRIRR
jgi:flagellar hook protein FlgE